VFRSLALRVLAAGFLLGIALGSSPAAAEEEPIGGVVLAEAENALPFAALDGFEAVTAPLRVALPAGVSTAALTDVYGQVIPFTGTHPEGVVGLPSLLGGTYEFRAGSQVARFRITGTGEVPVDPGPVKEPAGAPYWLSLFPAAVALGMLTVRRLRPVAFVLGVVSAGSFLYLRFGVTEPVMADCARAHADPSAELLDCSVRRGAVLVDRGEFPRAVRELEEANIGTCHEVAHMVGVRSWLRSSDPVAEVLRPGFDVCGHAFYHGALYGGGTYMVDDDFAAAVLDACDTIYPEDGPGGGACAHGVGHSLMVRFGHDLERVDEICRAMRTDVPQRVLECRGAALMEYAVIYARASGDPTRAPVLGRHPTELCQEADADLQVFCYGGLAMATKRVEGSARRLLEFCENLGPSRVVRCVEGVVPEFRSHLGRERLDGGVCRAVSDPQAVEVCARQYAYFLFDQYADSEIGEKICAAAGVPVAVCKNAESAARDWSRTPMPDA